MAVLARLPVAAAPMLATTVNVAVLPTGRLTVSLMLPLPLAVKPDALPVATAVQVALVDRSRQVSVTVAPVTLLGPLLVTTIV